MNSTQIFDLIVLGTLAFCAWRGASRGLLSQAAWIVALILCFKFSGVLAPAIEPALAVDQPLRHWIAMAIVYVGLCLGSFVAASILTSWLERTKLRDFDRHLGALLGLLKGTIICMTVMFFALTLSESTRAVVAPSRSAYLAARLLYHLDPLIPLVPKNATDTIHTVIDAFNRNVVPPDQLSGGTTSDKDVFGGVGTGDGSSSDRDSTDGSGGFNLSDLWNNKSQPANEPIPRDPTFQDLLKRLPEELPNELTRRASDAFLGSTAEEKRRLLQELESSLPEESAVIISDFLNSLTSGQGGNRGGGTSGGASSAGAPAMAQLSRQSRQLVEQIAEVYGDRQYIISQTQQRFAGVPEAVQYKVLQDWYADLMLLNEDPDTGTTIRNTVDERILRQLSQAGISLDRLDQTLRSRLRLSQKQR